MKISLSQKTKKRLIVVALGTLLVVFSLSFFMNPTYIGGSVWQFDYEVTNLTVNGESQGGSDYPDGTDYSDGGSYGGGGGGDYGVLMDLTYSDVYNKWADVDGNPTYDPYRTPRWEGLLPDVGVSVSLPWRVNYRGERLDFNQIDPDQTMHNLTDRVVYEYYYQFTVEMATKSDTFLVPATVAWSSAEAGDMLVESTLRVAMQKKIFASNISGTFADAKIADVEVSNLNLQSDLIFRYTPGVDIMQDINTGVPISNRVEDENFYTCDLKFVAGLTSGLVQQGINLLPYDVWIVKTVRMTVLLEQPLEIGTQGEGQEPFDPPDWFLRIPTWAWLIIGIVVLICLVVLAYAVIRILPAIILARRAG